MEPRRLHAAESERRAAAPLDSKHILAQEKTIFGQGRCRVGDWRNTVLAKKKQGLGARWENVEGMCVGAQLYMYVCTSMWAQWWAECYVCVVEGTSYHVRCEKL